MTAGEISNLVAIAMYTLYVFIFGAILFRMFLKEFREELNKLKNKIDEKKSQSEDCECDERDYSINEE